MSYNYLKEMKKDIRNYIDDEINFGEFDDLEELEEELNERLWTCDSVTGNASGSYTFCRETAKEYVLDNMDLLEEAADEFFISDKEIGEKFLVQDWEYFDVTIRCYLLGMAISDVIDTIDNFN